MNQNFSWGAPTCSDGKKSPEH